MSPRNWLFRIVGMVDALEAIREYTKGMTYDEFVGDRKTVDAVVRNLTIIGEASAYIPEEVADAYREIQWNEMRAMRNIVVHQYFGVSNRILWETITINLPPLAESLAQLLKDVGGQ